MKVLVLGGSPKGRKSVTLQYALYLAQHLPGWELEVHHVAQRIKALERDPAKLEAVVERVREADLVLWAFPLYYGLVCSQYKRFVELVEERGLSPVFAGKATATLSTSIKFFDHLPHAWLRAMADDWDMRHVGWWSAHMHDLFEQDHRVRLEAWGHEVHRAVEADLPAVPLYQPVPEVTLRYEPGPASSPVDLGGKRAVVIHDAGPEDANLLAMVKRVSTQLGAEVHNLREIGIKAGCQGCCSCGLDNQCIFEGRDGYNAFHRDVVQHADVLLFAGTIRSRHLSHWWRAFFDRSFFMGHAPSLLGRHFAWLVSGPLSHLPEMRELYEAWVQLQHSDLTGWVSDEAPSSSALDVRLDALTQTLASRASTGVVQSWDFRAEGGRLVFRDEIWLRLRVVFQADHRRYKQLGYYDFPQRKWTERLKRDAFMAFLAIPPVRSRFPGMIRDKMVEPYKKLLASPATPGAHNV